MFRGFRQKEKNCKSCPIARVADVVGDSWSILIIRDLLSGTKRFGDLESSLVGISSRTLTKKLLFLEEEKIISREEFQEKPPRVQYSLTKKGKELHTIVEAMRKYGQKYL